MRNLPVKLTDHSIMRIRKRFGLSQCAVLRLAEDVALKGKVLYSSPKSIKIEHNSYTYIFIRTLDRLDGKEVLLLITACNDDKSSEWIHYHHGERRTYTATKQSKINRGAAVNKGRGSKHHNLYYSENDCA